ncbi:WD40 repeat domain-containing protein [Shewanella intestini]|uniref:PQQ-binding-like beta-propeller repeat protein n=1 Tax=Shewanella intestini TaxID=2017544 RepID=A0ABS5I6A7_9GAMM|nr:MULTISPECIES: hypothetical protein [Shewanella]MBR9729378.1 hypothetical protein [Shewanella intestini]MRG37457.1 hypothetical protein [Shewanella sp. XMDDZSB0408]
MIRFLLLVCYTVLLSGCQPAPSEFQTITTDAVYNAELSRDGKYLIISTANNGVQLWDTNKKVKKYQWVHGKSGQANDVIDAAISPNAQYAATLNKDSLVVWDIQTGKSVGWWSLPATARSVAISNNGHVLVGLVDASVMSLSIVQNKLIQFLGHQEKINSVSISANGTLALSGGNGGKVILWETQTGQPLHQWQLSSRITKVLLSDDGKLSFAADITGDANIWHSGNAGVVGKLNIKRRQISFSAAKFVNNDTQILTGTPAREVMLWQIDSGKLDKKWHVQLTKNTKNKGAVVYSVAMRQPDKVMSISSKGLLEIFSTQ